MSIFKKKDKNGKTVEIAVPDTVVVSNNDLSTTEAIKLDNNESVTSESLSVEELNVITDDVSTFDYSNSSLEYVTILDQFEKNLSFDNMIVVLGNLLDVPFTKVEKYKDLWNNFINIDVNKPKPYPLSIFGITLNWDNNWNLQVDKYVEPIAIIPKLDAFDRLIDMYNLAIVHPLQNKLIFIVKDNGEIKVVNN